MRTVQRIVKSVEVHEGAGFVVHRPFPTPRIGEIDPFLLIDELGPTVYAPGKAIGAPDHPHRGFETATYVLEGEVFHEDSSGAKSELRKGDAQFMTAGRGVVHSELPSAKLLENGGGMHGVQIWINLPKNKKMIAPKYQDLRSSEIPTFEVATGARVKLLSGSLHGRTGPGKNETPLLFAHVTLSTGARWATNDVPAGNTTLAYVLSGHGSVADTMVVHHTDLVEFSRNEGDIRFANTSDEEFSFLLLSGAPIGEPISRMGPFVMNTPRELEIAYQDYMAGRMGAIGRGRG